MNNPHQKEKINNALNKFKGEGYTVIYNGPSFIALQNKNNKDSPQATINWDGSIDYFQRYSLNKDITK